MVVHMSGRRSSWFHDLQTAATLTLHGHCRASQADGVQHSRLLSAYPQRFVSGDHSQGSSPFALREQQQHAPQQVIAQVLNAGSPLGRSGFSSVCWLPSSRPRHLHKTY
jgi:hypothetical protein